MKRLLYPLLLVLCAGCNRYYYRPNAVNAPLFTGGGQVHAAASIGLSGQNNTNDNNHWNSTFANFQGAFSPINHLAFMLNYSSYSYNTDHPDTASGNVNGSAHLLEGAVGGYYAKGRKFKLVADCFVGYGAGPIWSDVNMNVDRFFVQPGIGVRSPGFDAAFNLRISTVNYSHFSSMRSASYLQDHDLIDGNGTRIDGRTYTFAEPSFTVRGGYKFLKIQMQAVLAQDLSDEVHWHYNGFMYTLGLYFSLEDALKMR